MNWFEVDREGLAKLIERRGKQWVVAELLQNAWDAPGVGRVELRIDPVPGRPLAEIVIEDDSPVGFADMTHAFTLFTESIKKSDPTLRGRFNLGEKLVLALCEHAEITSTTGKVVFGPDGRKEHPRIKRNKGTVFYARVRMTRADVDKALEAVRSFIVPPHIFTVVNGGVLPSRMPLKSFDWRLDTEVADEDGILRRTRRKTQVSVYKPIAGQPGRIYEMGIPIVETGDPFDVDIGQKVPLSLERDSVTPAYLRDVRVGVFNHGIDLVPEDAASDPWLGDALEDPEVDSSAVATLISKRFGDKVVAYDPSDKEANSIAVASGYKVIHGGAFSGKQWEAVRSSGVVRPAGQVTPSPRPFDPDGEPARHVEPTAAMERFAAFCKTLARETLDIEIGVTFLENFNATAAYGGRVMSFNIRQLGKKWFEGDLRPEQLDLVIHELGHEIASDHFSRKYNDALTRIGAKTAFLALEQPYIFDLSGYDVEAAPAPAI